MELFEKPDFLLTFFTFRFVRSIVAVIFSVTPQLLWDTAAISAGKLSWFTSYYKGEETSPAVRSSLRKLLCPEVQYDKIP